MKYTVKQMSTGLYEPIPIGHLGPLTYEEAKRAADHMNDLILSGQVSPSTPRTFTFPELNSPGKNQKDEE